MRYTFTLRVEQPVEVDPVTLSEIARAAEKEDDLAGATLRWLGSIAGEAEDLVNSLLPEGWHAKVEDGVAQEALF